MQTLTLKQLWELLERLGGFEDGCIKALTLTEPWATLVRLEAKCVETRGVLYKHRGPLAIHSSTELDPIWQQEPFCTALNKGGITRVSHFPLGKVSCIVNVSDGCRFSADPFPNCMPGSWYPHIGKYEKNFGNYAAGRGGMLLSNGVALAEPISVRGFPGLWTWKLPCVL